MEEEQVKAEARKEARAASFGAPFRFFCMPGETKEIVIVDEGPDFFRHEHALQTRGTKRWDTYVPCIDEHANCPVCAQAERPAYFAMYLTIIDLTPYVNKDNETVEFSKKLLVIKPTQQKKIMRLYERYKSLRGMVLAVTRDTKEDAQIGNDIEYVEHMDEEELLTYVTDYVDKEGKVHEIDCSVTYDYDQLMPDMTDKQLRAIVGGRPDGGSREATDAELGRDAWNNEPAARRPAARRGAVQDDQDDQGQEAPAPRRAGRAAPEPAPAPARSRRAAAPEEAEPAPAPRRAGRAAPAPIPDDDIDPATGAPWDDAQQEAEPEPAPAPRRAGRAAPREEAEPAAAPRRAPVARRGAAQQEQDDEPQRPTRDAASVSARRASLRRS